MNVEDVFKRINVDDDSIYGELIRKEWDKGDYTHGNLLLSLFFENNNAIRLIKIQNKTATKILLLITSHSILGDNGEKKLLETIKDESKNYLELFKNFLNQIKSLLVQEKIDNRSAHYIFQAPKVIAYLTCYLGKEALSIWKQEFKDPEIKKLLSVRIPYYRNKLGL